MDQSTCCMFYSSALLLPLCPGDRTLHTILTWGDVYPDLIWFICSAAGTKCKPGGGFDCLDAMDEYSTADSGQINNEFDVLRRYQLCDRYSGMGLETREPTRFSNNEGRSGRQKEGNFDDQCSHTNYYISQMLSFLKFLSVSSVLSDRVRFICTTTGGLCNPMTVY